MRWMLVGTLVLVVCALAGVWVTWPRGASDPAAGGISLADFQRGMRVGQLPPLPGTATPPAGPAVLYTVVPASAPATAPKPATVGGLTATVAIPRSEFPRPPRNDLLALTMAPPAGLAQTDSGNRLQPRVFPRERTPITYRGEERPNTAAATPPGHGRIPHARAVHRPPPTSQQRSADRHDPAAHAGAVHVAVTR